MRYSIKKFEFDFDPSLMFLGNTYARLPFCLGFDVLNLFSSIKTVSSWFPIGGVSTLSDMMMTCFESSSALALCSNFLSNGEIFSDEKHARRRKFLLMCYEVINESTSSLIVFKQVIDIKSQICRIEDLEIRSKIFTLFQN